MNKKLLFALIFFGSIISSDILFSQKYWVMFKNKTGTPYSVTTPSAYLSPKSIARRTAQGITINSSDLPVTPSYVAQIAAVPNVTVMYRSKWINGIVISVTNTVALTTISSFSFVQTTNRVNKYQISHGTLDKSPIVPNSNANKTSSVTPYNYGQGAGQAAMIGADCLHNMGYRGEGMIIAILDAGFLNAHIEPTLDSLFIQKRVLGTRDFVIGDTMVFEDNVHGAWCLSAMAALSSGTLIGTAPKASYWLLRTEDAATETMSEEYNWCRGIEFADSVGADVTTTSLIYTQFDAGPPSLNDHTYASLDGKTSPMSISANLAARKGMLVLNAAGNYGGGPWFYVGVPADADSIIAVGAVDPSGFKAGFSSFGPTSDGRIKPDLVAQGGPAYVCNAGCFFGNGTSFATPVLAGAVTCLWQYKNFATNMQIIAALKATADSTASPNNRIGWGIPHMCAAALTLTTTSTLVNNKDAVDFVKIYPNPNNGILNVELGPSASSGLNGKDSRIKITNTLGQTILEESSTIQHLTFNIQNFPSGIYFINVSSSDHNITKKIVKQ
jgi:serine protease AprX